MSDPSKCNEAADAVANAAALQDIPTEKLKDMLIDIGIRYDDYAALDWWRFWACAGNEYTKYIGRTRIKLPLQDQPMKQKPEGVMPGLQAEETSPQETTNQMKAATMNVLTLYDTAATTTARAGISARMDAFAKQCLQGGWNIVGLQDTRGYFQVGPTMH